MHQPRLSSQLHKWFNVLRKLEGGLKFKADELRARVVQVARLEAIVIVSRRDVFVEEVQTYEPSNPSLNPEAAALKRVDSSQDAELARSLYKAGMAALPSDTCFPAAQLRARLCRSCEKWLWGFRV